MKQRYFIDSWLLPCSLRSHRIANPRPKIGFAKRKLQNYLGHNDLLLQNI